MFPLSEIQEIRSKVVRYNLPRPEWFDRGLTDWKIQENFNGIGSDKFKLLVEPANYLLSIYLPAAMIHDMHWSVYGDMYGSTFDGSNSDFRAGCHICASEAKPIIKIFRPAQRRIYHEIAEDLYKVVSGPIGRKVWEGK